MLLVLSGVEIIGVAGKLAHIGLNVASSKELGLLDFGNPIHRKRSGGGVK